MRKFLRLVFLSKCVDRHRFFDHWVARLIRHPGIAVIPNSAAPEEFNQPLPDFRNEFSLGTGCLFSCVANYSTRKNQELAVRAFRKARLAGTRRWYSLAVDKAIFGCLNTRAIGRSQEGWLMDLATRN